MKTKAQRLAILIVFNPFVTVLLGQSYSTFQLYNADPVNAPVFDSQGVPLAGQDYLAELWGSTTPESLIPAYDLRTGERVMVPFYSDPYEGYFVSAATLVMPAEFFNGGFSWLQVRAWDARLGATYEEVAALGLGGYGESPLFYANGGNPFLALPDIPRLLIGMESFNLRAVVPEPSTWALLALGGLALIWTKRGRGR